MDDATEYIRRALPELLQVLQNSDVRELHIADSGTQVRIHRASLSGGQELEVTDVAAEPETLLPGAEQITAPLVGTFYRASQPGAPPLVEEGSTVTEDTVVGIIEALQVLTEVEAGRSGVVSKVLATDGHAVQYGQPLFEVVPVV
ncbi:MAG TPA: biotin/lipoyl-containing protein [Chloroflexota bacterium]|nr:biotin/lipoyl-containing protein [Chloroflexota bacterium]